jgi:hypothetical protein
MYKYNVLMKLDYLNRASCHCRKKRWLGIQAVCYYYLMNI